MPHQVTLQTDLGRRPRMRGSSSRQRGARAQQASPPPAVVVDQTGLPLPGVRIEVHRGDDLLQSLVTGADGTFELMPGRPDDVIEVALEGFETTRVRARRRPGSSCPSPAPTKSPKSSPRRSLRPDRSYGAPRQHDDSAPGTAPADTKTAHPAVAAALAISRPRT
jgi:hypothetical protein